MGNSWRKCIFNCVTRFSAELYFTVLSGVGIIYNFMKKKDMDTFLSLYSNFRDCTFSGIKHFQAEINFNILCNMCNYLYTGCTNDLEQITGYG